MGAGPEPAPGPEPGPGPQPPGRTRFFDSKRLLADRYASDSNKLANGVLGPLGATSGVTLNVTVAIERQRRKASTTQRPEPSLRTRRR